MWLISYDIRHDLAIKNGVNIDLIIVCNNYLMGNILDIFFPKACTVCSKHGEYLCYRCKKLFKRNLPECYICRKLSAEYKTHDSCMKKNSLDSVVVLWEYGDITSKILKRYKYGLVYDLESTLESLVQNGLEGIIKKKSRRKRVVISVPISLTRLRDRGFNQVDAFAKAVSSWSGGVFSNTLLARKDSDTTHQALLDKDERRLHSSNFIIQDTELLKSFEEIIIVDDVITTGKTLEDICKCIREVNMKIRIEAVCLFRGKTYYIDKRERRA